MVKFPFLKLRLSQTLMFTAFSNFFLIDTSHKNYTFLHTGIPLVVRLLTENGTVHMSPIGGVVVPPPIFQRKRNYEMLYNETDFYLYRVVQGKGEEDRFAFPSSHYPLVPGRSRVGKERPSRKRDASRP